MKITFLPQNIAWEAEAGETVLQAAVKAGVNIDGNCGGMGTCGKCRVQILEGDLSSCKDPYGKLTEDDKQAGVRLACFHQVSEGMVVMMAESETTASRKKKMLNLPENFSLCPQIQKYYICLEPVSLENQHSHEERIKQALGLKELHFDRAVLQKIPSILAETQSLTVTLRDGCEVIDLEGGDHVDENYGIAVDIGTTTVVVMAWNLTRGEMVDVFAGTNPQGAYGADVISRITYAMDQEENLEVLHQAIMDCINKAIQSFEEAGSIKAAQIYAMSVVGNTTMSHIFLNVYPASLAVSPFSPVFTGAVKTHAQTLGLCGLPKAEVYVSPNIAGHVGSDITAGIITTDLIGREKGHLFIDIGTNGEIVLAAGGKAFACSTAAGPAFEGSSIKQGMRAAKGAIERVELLDEGVSIKTIGDCEPVGICGSGIIDAVGELIRRGIVDKTGRLLGREKLAKKGLPEQLLCRIRENGKANDFVLYESPDGKQDVVITQKDVREVQLAKAAISAGISIMMKEAGLEPGSLEKISIAGAFGSYIRNSSAIKIGLLPKIEEEKIYSLGNSAGIGASMILLSKTSKEEAEFAAEQIQHVELAARSDFQDQYMLAMMF